MRVDNNRITLQIVGSETDDGDVRFDDFLKQLNAIKKALTETDRLVSEDGQSVYFRVVDLRHLSPAALEIEAVPIEGKRNNAIAVMDTFYSAVTEIQRKQQAPAFFDYPALQAFKELPTYKNTSITRTTISRSGDELALSRSLPETVDKILGPDIYEHGSITGMIDQINIHGQNVFTVYPLVRLPKLKCVFPKELRKQAIQAIGQHVTIYGRMKYKKRDLHPFEMDVESVDIHPEDDFLPSLGELRGTAPGITGRLTSDEFVRQLRDDWD